MKPKDSAVKRINDADYTEYVIRYGSNLDRQWLEIWSGPTVSNGLPPEAMLVQSVELRTRALKCGSHTGSQGVDIGGKLADGSYWRWVRYPPEMVALYKNAPQQAAQFFDQIIDGLCCRSE